MKSQKNWHNTTNNNKANNLTTILFSIYSLVLVWVLLLKLGVRFSYMSNRQVNLIPFNEVLFLHSKIDKVETILNILVFVPMGIYVGILFKKWSLGNKIFFCFLMSLLFEGLQFIIRIGAFDATDLVTNTVGGILGLAIFEAIKKTLGNDKKAQNFINITAGIGTTVIVLLLFLLKMKLLPIRYQ